LGRVVVKRLLDAGAAVAAVHRSEERFLDLVGFAGGRRKPLSDSKPTSLRKRTSGIWSARWSAGTTRRCPLNLVGAYRGGADVAGTAEEDWDFLMRVNLKSAFLCSRAVLPAMMKAGFGRIVCVAARPAVEKKGRARSGAYAVSKAGIVVLTETIAEEARKSGVTANCIVPGTIDTPRNRADMPGGDASKWADPGRVAEVLLFLVSDASSVTSGAAIPVFGKS
jgi:NAD(P)-dependent dehydrogenase (short-subunit alcohol dehydrogenase family)